MSTIDTIGSDYYAILARIESNNNPLAKASTSSASGLYQFVKSTAQGLGLPWGKDTSKPFGGATVTIGQQNDAIKKFTEQNAAGLKTAINNATLYAAHFLGVGTANKVLTANQNTPIDQVVSAAVIKANPFLKGMTVGDFGKWLEKKTGVNPFRKAAA